MSEASNDTFRVGIRELRQNLSVYVRRIHRGERFEVTEHGRPVALLVPIAGAMSPLARLVAAGRARMPEGDLLDLPPLPGEPSTTASEAIIADREDRS